MAYRASSPLAALAALLLFTPPVSPQQQQPQDDLPPAITVDVNVKVEKALDDFFGDLDKKSATIEAPKP